MHTEHPHSQLALGMELHAHRYSLQLPAWIEELIHYNSVYDCICGGCRQTGQSDHGTTIQNILW